jgi:hypothetical protein
MAFIKKTTARQYANNYVRKRQHVSSRSIVNESEKFHYTGKTYDVFLSHSSKDTDLVLGVRAILEEQGKSVYVDWLDDAGMDRTKVTRENADMLRSRMKACSSLIFMATENASTSKWVPWELGYFDGYRENSIAILPLVEDWQTSFEGQEYLALYPIIEQVQGSQAPQLYVHRRGELKSANMDQFVAGRVKL